MKPINFYFSLLLTLALITSCDKDDINYLTVSRENIVIPASGGTANIVISTDADSWNIDNPANEWLKLTVNSGTQKEALIGITVESKTILPRKDTLTVKAGNAKPVYIIVSQASVDYLYELSTNRVSASFKHVSGSVSMIVTSDATKWTLSSEADWIDFSQSEGSEGATTVEIKVSSNPDTNERSADVTLSAEHAPISIIPINQKGTFPCYNTNPLTPDKTEMNSSAMEIANNMTIGWNIGNTLEAIGGETAWGNPLVTERLIQLVKENGFNAIRIPCSWHQHIENQATAKIKESWLNRVKEVVQYCVDNDMYVILNIHWDGGWLENNVSVAKQEEVNTLQKALWEQIATHFRDFDERLIFAGANEPHAENATQMTVLNSYHQTFIDAVRSTGGRNSYRTLVIQGPSTDIDKTYNLMTTLPNDETKDRLMMEVHYYTPSQFCLLTEDATWGKMFYYWGKNYHSTTDSYRNAEWGEEDTLDRLMTLMKTQFVDKGIPVILGEFAVVRRTSLTGENLDLHLASRAHFLRYMTRQAKANGLIPFYWDAGNMGNNASALFNRRTYTVYDQVALDALIEGVSQ